MNHLKWMGHCNTIFDIQKNLRNNAESCEVTLAAKDGSVRAHRFVLSSCSDLLRSLLSDIPLGQEATIVVPDIKGSLLDSVLAYIYMGETVLTSSNLSDFLEAINILGIKSAISFECNASNAGTTGNATTTSAATMVPVKAISGLQIAQEEFIDQDSSITSQKIEAQNVIAESQTSSRTLDLFDVYGDQQHKITYSIEHMHDAANSGEFILTENSGTFTLTQNPKLESSTATQEDKITDMDDDADDGQIIEEYSSSTDPIIEIATTGNISPGSTVSVAAATTPVVQIKTKTKAIKLKSPTFTTPQQQQQRPQQSMETLLDSSPDPISILKNESFSSSAFNEGQRSTEDNGALEQAVLAVINEGISLQKAAHKYDLSKTVLWRRVRKHPNYMKTNRENPVLTMAYERIKSGDSLKAISRELDIPMSTLHRHKVRLAQQGRLPDYVSFKKRDANSKDQLRCKLIKAVHACVHEGMSQNHAANLFDIPKSTLWRHLQKRVAEAELKQEGDTDTETETIKEEVILS